MSWIILIIAALFEIGWPLGFKLSMLYPERHWLYLGLGILSYALSGVLLYIAQKTIPISTAYVVWGGAGAVFTFLIGIFLFGDSASVLRIMSACLIVLGIVGLELFA